MKKLIAVLLAAPLLGCATTPAYYSTLEDNSICCTIIDSFHYPTLEAPEKGRSNSGEMPQWISANDIDAPQNKSVLMVLTAPGMWTKNPGNYDEAASMGVFATNLNLDGNSKFTLSATLQWPEDQSTRQLCSGAAATPPPGWTVTLVAREGGRDDTYDLSRIQLSFKSTGFTVDMRVQQIDGTVLDPNANTTLVIPAKQTITPADHWKIFCNGEPFTLKLDIDRAAGTGTATIDAAGLSYPPLPITLTGQFAAGSGPNLTAAGVAVANAFSPGETVDVRVKDFKIWKN